VAVAIANNNDAKVIIRSFIKNGMSV